MLNLQDLIRAKRSHLQRLSNRNGAAGEARILEENLSWVPAPKGKQWKILSSVLEENGIFVKRSGFDAIAIPDGRVIDFTDIGSVRAALPDLRFVEIKTANQVRVRDDFGGFYFALTESEIKAAEALGNQHCVLLLNKITGASLTTSVPEIIARAKSATWQISVQL